MKFLHTFKAMYRGSSRFKIAALLFTFLLAFILTLLLETLYFNKGRFYGNRLNREDVTTEYAGFVENPDGTVTPQGEEAIIYYKFPKAYVNRVSFYGYAESDKPITYELSCLDSYPPPYADFYNTFLNSKETYVIDAQAEEFTVFIYGAAGIPMRIELGEIDYTFNNNPVRMATTFIILLLLFYLFYAISGAVTFKIENIAFVLIFGFGILYAYLIPTRYNYDEYAHLVRATNIAAGNFTSEPEERIAYPSGFESIESADYRSLEDFSRYYEYFEKKKDFESEVENIPTGADSYIFIPYIFSAAGVFFARLFGMSVYYVGVMSKLFNVFLYAVLIYFSVKIVPSNKLLVFFLAATPIMLSSATTAGITGVQNGCFFLGISYLAYLIIRKESYTWRNYALLVTLFAIVTVCKMTYGFFLLLLLLLDSRKFEEAFLRRYNKLLTIALTFVLMGAVYTYSSSIGIDLLNVSGSDFGEQLDLILKDPMGFVFKLWKYTTTIYLNGNVLQDMGYIVYTGRISGLYTLFGAVLLIILSFAGDREEMAFDTLSGRVLLWAAFILSIAATEAAMYLTFTSVGSRTVDGFQSRYVYSILLAPLLTLEGRNFYLHYNKRALSIVTALSTWVILLMTIGTLIVKYYK